jgi:CRP/FNR family transcriptional regulator, cyclic AMP receptor protein
MLPDAACAMFGESVGRLTSRCNQHVVAPGRAPVYGGHQMAVPGPADHLRKVAIFKGLDAADLDRLTQACRRRKYRDHEALFHEGDPGYTLYVILSGHVSVQRINDTGQVVPIAARGPGECIGELSLLDGKPRSADAETIEPCELLALDRDAFVACLDRSPALAREVIRCLAARLREAADTTDTARSTDVTGRVCAFLLELARTHGTAMPDGTAIVSLRLTQQEIADRVGTTRETVNRSLARLRELGTIRSQSGRIVVRDAARLRKYASG